MNKKRQHVIPQCYQKAWCDPATPPNQTPYIWMISKDGKDKKRRAPEKAFSASDVYTIRLPNGERELVVEDTLMKIESRFIQLLKHKISKHYTLDDEDRAVLCVFAAAMFSRVYPQYRNWETFVRDLHNKFKSMEEEHNAEPRASLETAAMLSNLQPDYVATSLSSLAPLYYDMSLAIFIAPETDQFITSDSPTVWYNPEAYKWPPYWRSPGLGQTSIEVTMPLTPQYLLFLSHDKRFTGYRILPGHAVQELNRRTRFHCDTWFVSWQGEVRSSWFDQRMPPNDRSENSADGKSAIEEQRKYERGSDDERSEE